MQSNAASVRHLPSQNITTLVSHRLAPKPIEAMLFMLPGIDATEAQLFKRWSTENGLVHHIRGDGVHPLSKSEFSKPVPGGLTRNAHILINGHGNVSGHNHTLCIDEDNVVLEKTSTLMEATRTIPRAGFATDAALENNITLHIFGCHVGTLRKQIFSDNGLWERGTFLMYGSRKTARNKDQLP